MSFSWFAKSKVSLQAPTLRLADAQHELPTHVGIIIASRFRERAHGLIILLVLLEALLLTCTDNEQELFGFYEDEGPLI